MSAVPEDVDYSQIPDVPATTFTAPLRRPDGVSDDWLEPAQRDYTDDEHAVWDALFARQSELLPGRACDQFLHGLDRLQLGRGGVPELAALNATLAAATGWRVVPVPMLIPDHVFFYHLANRRFPAGNFIRRADRLDYIEEPDVFHDVFGHVPLLADPVFANYMQAYGRAGWKALRYNRLKALAALYWYTVEFGLITQRDALRVYGAGILSSAQELTFALEAESPNRIYLAVDRVVRTDYRIDDLQQTYFVVESFEQLYHLTEERRFEPIYASLDPAFKYAPSALLDTDHVHHAGSQEYALRGGRGSNATPV